jgi:hypothetical protein
VVDEKVGSMEDSFTSLDRARIRGNRGQQKRKRIN